MELKNRNSLNTSEFTFVSLLGEGDMNTALRKTMIEGYLTLYWAGNS